MGKNLTDYIYKHTKLKSFLLFLILTILAEIAFSLIMPNFTEKSGYSILDMSTVYSVDDAYLKLNAINKAPNEYLVIRLIDTIFPILYGLMLSILSCIVYKRKYKDLNNYRWVLLVPILGAISDYIENIIIISLKLLLPKQFPIAIYV
ncbi:MAG: hypothetical protein PQJ46_15380, partial [Spirochaetales bacterium]|nr:hypothetical protein [Spirochaetales bacterium]